MRRAMVTSALIAGLVGCGEGDPPRPAASKPQLRLPTVRPGDRCPVSPSHVVTSRFARVLGDGPIYPAGLGVHAVLRIAPAERFNSRAWGGDKVLWVRRPGVHGTIVIRGRRLDAPGRVRFDSGDVPPDRLDLRAPSPDGWAGYPSYTRVQAPGCYAYVVDGPGVHEVIVFRAAWPPTARRR